MPQKIQCTVTNLIDHGERVYSVFLKPVSLVPRFRPGQFIHLALDPYTPGDFWPESRVFSIAAHRRIELNCAYTYAVKEQFTSRMEAEIQAGRQVWVKLPYGEFMINNEGDACLLAGGTGITAFYCLFGWVASSISPQCSSLLWSPPPGASDLSTSDRRSTKALS